MDRSLSSHLPNDAAASDAAPIGGEPPEKSAVDSLRAMATPPPTVSHGSRAPQRGSGVAPGPDEKLWAGSLSRVLQCTSIPIIVIDARHLITHWNQACENLTGFAAGQVVGTGRAWKAFYPSERPVLADFIVDQRPRSEIVTRYGESCRESRALPGGYEFEAYFPDLGGGSKWLFVTAAPLRDPSGAVLGAVETFQDVTERKQVEQELEHRVAELSEAKRRLEVLISYMTDREKRMVNLKSEVNQLLQTLGRVPKYDVPQQVAELGAADASATAK